MALRNDPRLYTGGTAVFDSRPHLQLYANLQAREQAKNEAFDEYIRNLNKNINPAGVRNQEQPILQEKINQWQQYGVQNRDKIRNPNKDQGASNMEFQKMYQDIRNLIEESKSLEEAKKPVVPFLLDPEKRSRIKEDFIQDIYAHDLPKYKIGEKGEIVLNPEWRPLDITKIDYKPKPFDQKAFRDLFKDIPRTALPPVITTDPNTMTQTVKTESVYDEKAKDVIAQTAITDYFNNPSTRELVDNLNPEEYQEVFQANFGRPIENKGDLATAFAMRNLQYDVVEQKVQPDVWARQQALARLNNQLATARMKTQDALIRARQKARDGENHGTILNNYVEQQWENGVPIFNAKGEKIGGIKIDGNPYFGRFINVPKSMSKKYATEVKIGDEVVVKEPDYWLLTDDKKYVFPLFDSGERYKGTGQIKFIPGTTKPIDILTYKTELRPSILTTAKAGENILEEFEDETGVLDDFETPSQTKGELD